MGVAEEPRPEGKNRPAVTVEFEYVKQSIFGVGRVIRKIGHGFQCRISKKMSWSAMLDIKKHNMVYDVKHVKTCHFAVFDI